MTIHDAIMGLAVTGFPLGMAAGYAIRGMYIPPPSDADIAKFMGRVVNQEEMEEHERLTRVSMMRNGRKTQRFDGGPHAKVMRVKVRPVAKRFRGQK